MNLLLYRYQRSMHQSDQTGHSTRNSPERRGSWLRFGACALLALSSLQCSSSVGHKSSPAYPGVYMPDPGNLRASARCQPSRHHRIYYVLYGATTIDRGDPTRIFPDTERFYYLIEEDRTVSDWVVSILFGTLFTVTRGSLYVTACEIPAGRSAVAPFQALPATAAGPDDGAADAADPANDPARDAQVRERVDAARERARAARERAERLRRENQE